MKAWTLSDYAEPATAVKQMTLREDVAIPKPNFGEVRVKISHAAVNPIDWKLFGGASPLFAAHAPYVDSTQWTDLTTTLILPLSL